MSWGEKAAAVAPPVCPGGVVPAPSTVNPLESSGLSVPSTNFVASSSVMAGIAVPSGMAMVCLPRGQEPVSCLREASTSRPTPLLAGVVTGLVPSRVTVAETAPLAIELTRSSRAPRSVAASTRMTASVRWPLRRCPRVRGLRVKPVSRLTEASASTETPELEGMSSEWPCPTVRVTG